MNEQAHWDGISTNYGHEIFDVFQSDRNKRLPRYFKKHANKRHTAIDFGCGTGKAFPYLSPIFKTVLGVDISNALLRQAKDRPYNNTTLKRLDLSAKNLRLPQADFVFCCNVIMLPEISKNEIMFRNLQKSLRPKGTGLVVVPSAESMLFSAWRMIDWYRKDGVAPALIPASELNYFKGKKKDILQGIIHIDGVPTKHYSEPELTVLFKDAGLIITALEKLNYDWTSEFATPPEWMRDPYPWDWLIECKKA